MILLEASNRILEETLRERFTNDAEKLLVTVVDFDGVLYRLSTPNNKTEILLSMSMPYLAELKQYGAMELLKKEYGDSLIQAEPGFDVTLRINLETIGNDSNIHDRIIQAAALIKRNALAAPFERAFLSQSQGQTTEIMRVNYREDGESFFVQAQSDRVTVIFSTVFKEETDQILGKVFLQEFVDARRQPSIQNAPQVLYNPKEPPLELRGIPNLKVGDNVGYVTFVLFPRHFSSPQAKADCISKIQLFRDYLHYHIKCSKAYMHTRMRARVDSFMKVLNRAKPEVPEDKKERKLASGRAFKRAF